MAPSSCQMSLEWQRSYAYLGGWVGMQAREAYLSILGFSYNQDIPEYFFLKKKKDSPQRTQELFDTLVCVYEKGDM